MTKIKICGLKRIEDVSYVNKFLPDYVGFILSDGYKRSIDFDLAMKLKAKLDKRIKVVGVFVDDDIEKIKSYYNKGVFDIVQLHGKESPDYCKALGKIPIIKAFKCDENTESEIEKYTTDYFLFDSGTGTGKTFDWSLIPKTNVPFFLAGGIDLENITTAIKNVNPFALDVSSSVETKGYKDKEKIKDFIRRVRYE